MMSSCLAGFCPASNLDFMTDRDNVRSFKFVLLFASQAHQTRK